MYNLLPTRYLQHPDLDNQQARLPQGCKLWGVQARGTPESWNVDDEGGLIIFGASSPEEAVNKFLAGSATQSMLNIEELFPNQKG